MMALRWFFRLVWDVVLFGVVNRSYALSGIVLMLIAVGLLIIGAQASAPFIYTLF